MKKPLQVAPPDFEMQLEEDCFPCWQTQAMDCYSDGEDDLIITKRSKCPEPISPEVPYEPSNMENEASNSDSQADVCLTYPDVSDEEFWLYEEHDCQVALDEE